MSDNNFNSDQNPANTDTVANLDCSDFIHRVGDLVDKDLPQNLTQAMEKHLDECVECTAFYASYKHVVDSAAELRSNDKPIEIGVQNRLRKALNQRLGINLPYIA